MTRSAIETILGAVVLLIAAYFLVFSYKTGHSGSSGDGFEIYADFSGIGGLKAGDDVTISGVKVGSVSAVELMPDSYLARVRMDLENGLKLPVDTAAAISSQSLLGGRYLALQPGAEEEFLKRGDKIEYTQAPQNLEELLGKFIFSVSDSKNNGGEDSGSQPPPEDIEPQGEAAPPISPDSEPASGQEP